MFRLLFLNWSLKRPVHRKDRLVAVAGEGFFDGFAHTRVERDGAAELANSLLRFARSEMAGAGGPVLDLSFGREAEALLRAFVCLLLGHSSILKNGRIKHFTAGGGTRKGGITAGSGTV